MSKKISILNKFICIENNTKLFHLSTTSYAAHKASDELLDELRDKHDNFLEIYIGKYGRDKVANKQENIEFTKMNNKDFCQFLKDTISFFQTDIFNYINENDTDLINIRDEIVGKINKTLYLLTLS